MNVKAEPKFIHQFAHGYHIKHLACQCMPVLKLETLNDLWTSPNFLVIHK